MAIYRHRTFEMFDTDTDSEAARSLESKSPKPVVEPGHDKREVRTFQCLTTSRNASLIQVTFKSSNHADKDNGADFATLADSLDNDNRGLMEFEGLEEFCATSIDELALLR